MVNLFKNGVEGVEERRIGGEENWICSLVIIEDFGWFFMGFGSVIVF